ncbi:hypothetical protein [Shewanella sp. Isolate7]|uniref:hypothetical protein n=1 Tax=Shewanella sp. Isolate7 TaxID=2908528 RepID=UPI001EFE6CB7|nr:hypothetical protein [Shewanella sp. Isolate7]MCG9720713.1 hypothetical protein [Shewanella sp. Isolate7]
MTSSQNRIVFTALTLCFSLLGLASPSYGRESDGREMAPSQREYQVTMSTLFAHGDSQQVTARARALLQYRVDSAPNSAKAVSLSVLPAMLQYQDPAYRLNINSFDDSGRGAALANIVRQGALLMDNGDSQSKARFKAQDEWHAYVAKQGQEALSVLAPLKSLFEFYPLVSRAHRPQKALAVGDTLRLGYLLPSGLGDFSQTETGEPQEWQIVAIEGQWIRARFEWRIKRQGIEYRRFGEVSFNRKTGWLDKLLLVDQQQKGDRMQARRWLMAPTSTPYVSSILWQDEGDYFDEGNFFAEGNVFAEELLEYDARGGEGADIELFDIPTLPMAPDDRDASAAMMEPDEGVMSAGWGGDDIELRYIHGLTTGDYATSVEYRNIELLDWKDRTIDLPLWQHSARGASAINGVVSSGVNLLPVGWGESKAKLEELYQIRAELIFTPVKRYSQHLPWPQLLKQPYRFGETTLTLSALSKPGRYRLAITNRSANALAPDFNGLQGKLGIVESEGLGPAWLSNTEQLLLDELFSLEQSTHVYILQLDSVPESLKVLHSEQLSDRKIAKQVSFVTQSTYEANLANPPLEPADLVPVQLERVTKRGSAVEPGRLSEPSIASITGNDLYIPLPSALAEVCQPQISEGFEEAGKSVDWRLVDNGQGQSAYVLTTPDGKRRYFYDKRIKGSIECLGRAHWQTLGAGDNRRPWLVDLTPWLSTLDKTEVPISQLYRSLVITDAQGRHLSPRLPKEAHSAKGSERNTLDKALVDGRWLSVDGAASSAAYLSIDHEPLAIPYQFHLKPLP